MFTLKKFIAYWLMPLQASLAAIILGLLLMRSARWRRTGRWLLISGVAWLALTTNKGIGTALVRPLEGHYSPQPEWRAGTSPSADLARCRSIVVLGGGHSDTEAFSANNRLSASALSRIVEAARIARALPEAELWVTGPRADHDKPTHASVLKAAAIILGISEHRIQESSTGPDTEGEVAALKPHIGKAPIALVTSAWHMPRSVALFRHAGMEVVPCPTDYVARMNDDFRIMDYLQWDLTGLDRSTRAIYEYLGLTWAKLRGRI